jgi:hypothetical protein
MKFEFVKEKELELINNRFAEENSIDYDNWDLMSDDEILICDAEMFAANDEAYCDNEFDSIEEFAKNASEGEGVLNTKTFQSLMFNTIENTIKRLNEMLIKGILKLK